MSAEAHSSTPAISVSHEDPGDSSQAGPASASSEYWREPSQRRKRNSKRPTRNKVGPRNREGRLATGQAAWADTPEGAEYVIPEEYRRRAQGSAGWANANLRTTLEKVIRRAGLEPWPRLWHSMRASCETDLARQFPLAVVAKWLGNTQAVAMRHYVDVTDADFERAIAGDGTEEHAPTEAEDNAVQNAAQSERAGTGCESHAEGRANEKAPVLQSSATCGETLQNREMEAAGIEPASRDISMNASTCVVAYLNLPRRPPNDRLFPGLAEDGF